MPFNTTDYASSSAGATALNATATGNGTTFVAGNEIALPGYLQVEATVDFQVDAKRKPLASGGGGTIYLGKFLNYGVGAKMFRDGVNECVVKEVKNIAISVFIQEVALMYYFRNTPSIIQLYGYNLQNTVILLPYFKLGSLQGLIKNVTGVPQWTMEIVVQLATDIFESLSIVHAASVVHYDIKSLNYLVKADSYNPNLFRAVLTDFGVCRILDEATKV